MKEKAKLTSTPENPPMPVPVPRSTQSKLKKSLKRAVLPLPNSVSKEELCRAFQSCTDEEQRRLHQLFLKVIASLHGNIEVGASLDTFDRLLEEQNLDPLMTDKSIFFPICCKTLARGFSLTSHVGIVT